MLLLHLGDECELPTRNSEEPHNHIFLDFQVSLKWTFSYLQEVALVFSQCILWVFLDHSLFHKD